uniref:DUF2924 domain-containing protein n=1 Tax=Ruegeria atlantica TaxID=81569 RepID=UPI002494EA2C
LGSYDEPETLSYQIDLNCPMGADVRHVTEDGFSWNSRSYRSLSAIAREITGAHWSGPRFFGLTSKGAK